MNINLLKGFAVVLAASAAVAACVSAPQPNAALELARSNVQTAEADPNAAKYAALDLDAAKQELQAAESAYMHHDIASINQPAYLASQTARLAQLKGAAKADDARVAAGQSEREQIALAARTREAQKEKMASDAAAAKAASLQAQVDALKAAKRNQ
jgi:Domain of unknown function (DUF4398)